MSSPSLPWIKFYPSDWLSSPFVRRLPLAARAIYMDLLAFQASSSDGCLPADPEELRRMVGADREDWTPAWERIEGAFEALDGGLVNPKMLDIWNERMASTSGATRNASARWGGEAAPRKRSQRMAEARKLGTHTRDEWVELRDAYGRCLRCSSTGRELVRDHVIPVYQGGSDGLDNIQPLCRKCNASKGPESVDYRVGLPETRPEWLPDACDRPANRPANRPDSGLRNDC